MNWVNKLIPKKELTEKELQQREYRKQMKKIKNKAIRNPLKIVDFIDEAMNLLDEMVEKGVITEKERDKQLEQYNKDFNKIEKIKSRMRFRK